MEMNELDCRGLACPAPVLETKDILEAQQPETIKVIVDNEAAKQNVSRFLESRHFTVTVDQALNDFHVIGQRGSQDSVPEAKTAERSETETQKIMVMVATDRMGFGDDELGRKLIGNFIKTLKEMGDDLWRLCLVNNGVKLTTPDSQALGDLKELEGQGITILVCGTCLTHFNLLEQKQVGETTNMLDIVTAMQLADKVINI